MKPQELRRARDDRGWTQAQLADRLGVSQAYVNQLEKGKRRFTSDLDRKLARVFDTPAALPLSEAFRPASNVGTDRLVGALAQLGYPGFSYVWSRRAKQNPAQLLLVALAQESLDPRVAEALPWVLLHHWDLRQDWLVEQARKLNLQNRLGFVVSLARRLSERESVQHVPRTATLVALEKSLDSSRLVQEESFGPPQTEAERRWLTENRPAEARHWNLLTDMRPEHLSYGNAA